MTKKRWFDSLDNPDFEVPPSSLDWTGRARKFTLSFRDRKIVMQAEYAGEQVEVLFQVNQRRRSIDLHPLRGFQKGKKIVQLPPALSFTTDYVLLVELWEEIPDRSESYEGWGWIYPECEPVGFAIFKMKDKKEGTLAGEHGTPGTLVFDGILITAENSIENDITKIKDASICDPIGLKGGDQKTFRTPFVWKKSSIAEVIQKGFLEDWEQQARVDQSWMAYTGNPGEWRLGSPTQDTPEKNMLSGDDTEWIWTYEDVGGTGEDVQIGYMTDPVPGTPPIDVTYAFYTGPWVWMNPMPQSNWKNTVIEYPEETDDGIMITTDTDYLWCYITRLGFPAGPDDPPDGPRAWCWPEEFWQSWDTHYEYNANSFLCPYDKQYLFWADSGPGSMENDGVLACDAAGKWLLENSFGHYRAEDNSRETMYWGIMWYLHVTSEYPIIEFPFTGNRSVAPGTKHTQIDPSYSYWTDHWGICARTEPDEQVTYFMQGEFVWGQGGAGPWEHTTSGWGVTEREARGTNWMPDASGRQRTLMEGNTPYYSWGWPSIFWPYERDAGQSIHEFPNAAAFGLLVSGKRFFICPTSLITYQGSPDWIKSGDVQDMGIFTKDRKGIGRDGRINLSNIEPIYAATVAYAPPVDTRMPDTGWKAAFVMIFNDRMFMSNWYDEADKAPELGWKEATAITIPEIPIVRINKKPFVVTPFVRVAKRTKKVFQKEATFDE